MAYSVQHQSDEARPAGPASESLYLLRPLGEQDWQLSSGRRLTHTFYSLIGCPAVKAATYLLVRQLADGTRRVLASRRTRSSVPSVNLADIRHAGARLGANEVHLYQGATSDAERSAVAADLAQGRLAAKLQPASPRIAAERARPAARGQHRRAS